MRGALRSIWERAHRETDVAALAAFRILFGALAFAIPTRHLLAGWVDRFYVQPTYLFAYWGFEWLPRPSAGVIHATFVAMAVAGALVSVGLFYRVAIAVFFVLFTYVELLDVVRYLNHYYLVGLLALIACFLPLHRAWSLDAWRRPELRAATLPAWITWLLRFQVATVYFYAALAKVSADWLLHAQPLQIWLGSRLDLPVIGALFDRTEVAYAMSWGGFLYDLTIPLWLSWRRTRVPAYVVLLVFHALTDVLFDIGMFPWIMSIAALVFFDPSWPRALLGRVRRQLAVAPPLRKPSPPRLVGARRVAVAALAAWCLVQVAMPLRAHVYGGNVLWHEQGMRWSWRVMCRAKGASVTYRVRTRAWQREREVPPSRYLTGEQEAEFAGQPDLIVRLAHHVAEDLRRRGHEDVEVRADAFASLNGRRSARLIDPDVDLARTSDSLAPASWILPEPSGPPASNTRSLFLASLGGDR